jgi:hypothetical protein
MSKYNGNVMVAMQRGVNVEKIRRATSALSSMTGILNARASRKVARLLLVDYDSRSVSYRDILEAVRREDGRSMLVGM